MIFLIDYDRARGKLESIVPFDDAQRDAAEKERFQKELTLHRQGVTREIVLLQAADEAALRETHRRYFEEIATLAETDTLAAAR
ncbi:MAG: hypothetical protein QOE82_1104 [Thermoanaerobaculia bacterium]|nr:hypothetical protein [Thermoanaerobaculia bacterium]